MTLSLAALARSHRAPVARKLNEQELAAVGTELAEMHQGRVEIVAGNGYLVPTRKRTLRERQGA
ncbi:hypothetical protein [Rhizobium leguminosarum]|uniref:hypothetical protein n=1 Tax=Rhizobium leguminosarum TaxID=384 RepID=UPI001AE70548|nr:hypothetical protein [Rhizobium leguminosarum]MBP2445257.1 hypothetical protein [Rhizobium leguminosarum]